MCVEGGTKVLEISQLSAGFSCVLVCSCSLPELFSAFPECVLDVSLSLC
jgi:hypothetical protein